MRSRDNKKIQAIYKATILLTGEIGIAGLTMSKISKRAKVAHGTLYVYFKNKEDLLNQLYASIIKRGTLSIMSQVADLPVREQLYALWESSLKFRVSNPSSIVFMEQFGVSPYISEETKALRKKFIQHLKMVIERGKKEKLIKPLANGLLIALLAGFVRNAAMLLVEKGEQVGRQFVDDSFTICWDAIALCNGRNASQG